MTEMEKKLADLHRIVLGNGNPESGIVFKLVRMEDSLGRIDQRSFTTETKMDKLIITVAEFVGARKQKEIDFSLPIFKKKDSEKKGLTIPSEVVNEVFTWVIKIGIILLLGEKAVAFFTKLL